MIAVFTRTGFICATPVVLALTYVAVVYLAYVASVKSSAVVKMCRLIWRFYKTLPDSKFGREGRFWAVIYDKDTKTFAHAQPLNSEFQTEAEFDAMREELRRKLTRKRGIDNDAA